MEETAVYITKATAKKLDAALARAQADLTKLLERYSSLIRESDCECFDEARWRAAELREKLRKAGE